MKTSQTSKLLASFAVCSVFLGSVLAGGSQNPFDSDDTPTGSADSASLNGGGGSGSQNPFGDNTGGSGSGSQNPFGGDTGGSGSGGSNTDVGPLLDSEGCPATRALPPSTLVLTNRPTCPDGDGKVFQTSDGAFFYMQCCSHGATTTIREFIAADFKECMTECARTDTCNSIQFIAHQRNDEPWHQCKLSKDGGYSQAVCGANDMHSYAFIIDPPPIESPDAATVLCSTECPYANGQQFTTAVGEAFHIDCGMRHGTKPIYKDRQNTLKECIEACGKLVPCHSVDYDTHRKICYYSNHQGEPTIPAPGFSSAHSVGCAGACGGGSCGNSCKKPDEEPTAPQDTSPFPGDGYLGTSTAPEALCPGLHGKIKSVNGKNYRMYCGVATLCNPATSDIRTPYPVKSLDECLADCANDSRCASMNFLNTDLSNGKSGECNIRTCDMEPTGAGNHICARPV